jgi:hypothetical protein
MDMTTFLNGSFTVRLKADLSRRLISFENRPRRDKHRVGSLLMNTMFIFGCFHPYCSPPLLPVILNSLVSFDRLDEIKMMSQRNYQINFCFID